MSEPSIAPKPVPLTWPFAVAGLVGGWLSADTFKPHGGDELRVLLALVTPVVAALLGRFLTSRIHGGPLRTALMVTAAIIGAGMINGVLLGLFLGAMIGVLIGVPFGALFALPFVPPLALVVLLARRVGRARPGSAVDASDRRAVWGAVAVSASLATLSRSEGATLFMTLLASFMTLLHRYNIDSRDGGQAGRMELVNAEEGVFNCTAVGYCSEVCPKHVDPANAVNLNKTNSAMDYFLRFLAPKGGAK